MTALLAAMLVVVGIYGAWYPQRETAAEDYFEEHTAKRGAITFARNCRLCHGDVGQGGAAGSRLPSAPALNRLDLQGFTDSGETTTGTTGAGASATTVEVSDGAAFRAGSIIAIDDERMEVVSVSGDELTVKRGVEGTERAAHTPETPIFLFDQVALDEQIINMRNVISCGRVGTAMPAWSIDYGGPLNDEQIRQLLVLISKGYWDEVAHEVDHEDERTVLAADIDAEELIIEVENVTVINEEEAYRIGDERVRVLLKIQDEGRNSGSIVVERGVLNTSPASHAADTTVYLFPEVGEPTINEESCGQIARPSAPPEPPGVIEPFDGPTLELTAVNIAFSTRALSAPANTEIRVRLINNDAGVDHNIAFYNSQSDKTPIAAGSVGTVFPGVETDDTVFTTPGAGSYFFVCDIHPTTMTGTLTVQ